LTSSTATTAPVPPGLVVAPQLPDLLMPVKIRRGVLGFLRSNPTVAIGGALLLCLVLIGIFAPYLGTVDPTALAPAITVNCVAPGPTATARFKAGPEFTDEIRDLIPLKRWVEPRDVARSVVFLASSDGNAYTGQILDPNGGTVMP